MKKHIYIMRTTAPVADCSPWLFAEIFDDSRPRTEAQKQWNECSKANIRTYQTLWKIGVSVCPESRCDQISEDLGWCDLNVYFSKASKFYRGIEHQLHAGFWNKRKTLQCTGGTEFFQLSGCDVLSAMNTICENAERPKWHKQNAKP